MHSEVVRHGLTVKLSLPLLRRRRNFTHEVNFTIADNFTCPKGKLSFSVFFVKDNTLIILCPFFNSILLFKELTKHPRKRQDEHTRKDIAYAVQYIK